MAAHGERWLEARAAAERGVLSPASLSEMVEAGLLGERYLTDENHQQLESRLESDRLIVESIGMDGVKGTEDDWRKEW